MRPNLFTWATSELSQDAFLCWMLEWAKPMFKGDPLHNLAAKFIEQLSGIDGSKIEEVEIRKQFKNIDIVVVINTKSAILIEDKVHGKDHSNQLSRYVEILKEEFSSDDLSLIYLKTGDQSSYRNVEAKGYKVFKRHELLKLLNEGRENGISNEIFIDFLDYLTNIEKSVNSFRTLPIGKWHWDSWKGFYLELQKRLEQGHWDYVPQKDGGFIGFWWHTAKMKMSHKETDFHYYLQLEQGRFCFKISPCDIKFNQEVRDYYRDILFRYARNNNIEIERNGRCIKGKTKTMTVAKLTSSYIVTDSSDKIDIDKTVEKIRAIESLMKKIEADTTV